MDASDNDPPAGEPLRPAGAHGGKTFFGHPRGLSTLFFSEMWERFSYYGMRAILLLFMGAPLAQGGLGFSAAEAGIVYGLYTSLVYLMGVPGGWIADKFLGLRRAVLIGGILIMTGHICLAIPGMATFYSGLGFIVLGTGLLKPNISTIVGQLYSKNDRRRDSGFTIFYMGINLGALLAPLCCNYLSQDNGFRQFLESMGLDAKTSWHFGFAAAAVGMGLGLIQYVYGWRYLGDAGKHPARPANQAQASRNRKVLYAILGSLVGVPVLLGLLSHAGIVTLTKENIGNGYGVFVCILVVGLFGGLLSMRKWTKDERGRLVVVMLLFFGAAVFWFIFDQAGSTLTLFARDHTQRHWHGLTILPGYFASVNSIFIIMLAPLFAWLWVALKRRDPSVPIKFGVGLVLVAAGFLIMIPAAHSADAGFHTNGPWLKYLQLGGYRVSPLWLILLYFLHTAGELCFSPVGLSSMTRLAPASIGGMVMGIWFLGASVGDYAAGRVTGLYASMSLSQYFTILPLIPLGAAAVFFLVARPVKRMIASTAPGATESAEESAATTE